MVFRYVLSVSVVKKDCVVCILLVLVPLCANGLSVCVWCCLLFFLVRCFLLPDYLVWYFAWYLVLTRFVHFVCGVTFLIFSAWCDLFMFVDDSIGICLLSRSFVCFFAFSDSAASALRFFLSLNLSFDCLCWCSHFFVEHFVCLFFGAKNQEIFGTCRFGLIGKTFDFMSRNVGSNPVEDIFLLKSFFFKKALN